MSVVVIPAYQPDDELIKLVKKLSEQKFSILIVDDGSSCSCNEVFNAVTPFAKVVHSKENEGKGAALKKGFSLLKELFPDEDYIITADADGQHRVEDIIRVREKLESGNDFVLSVRYLQGKIPFRSKFGNVLSRIVYTILTGHFFDDNQSGLRGFHKKHIDWLLKVKGNKYDYEMNMLCYADKQGIKIATMPIKAIYIDGNKSSHFNPVKDTVRIYKRLFSSLWPSLVSVLIMLLAFAFISAYFSYNQAYVAVPFVVVMSTLISIFLQRFVVFRKVIYKDYFRTLLFGAIRASAYTGIIKLIGAFTQSIPIFILLFAGMLIALLVEYQIHKIMHKIMWIG